MEEETGSRQIRGGEYPWNREVLAVSVRFAGVEKVPRVEQLKQQAVEAQESAETVRGRHGEALAELSEDELDPLL